MWDWHAVAQTPEGYSDAALGVRFIIRKKDANIVHHDPRGSVQYQDAGPYMWHGPLPRDRFIPTGYSWP